LKRIEKDVRRCGVDAETRLHQWRTRVKAAQGRRFELLRIREELETYMRSAPYESVSTREKDATEDLLMEVLTTIDECKGCDPLKSLLGPAR